MRVGESPKLKLEVTCAVSHAKDYGRFPLNPGVWVRNQMKAKKEPFVWSVRNTQDHP